MCAKLVILYDIAGDDHGRRVTKSQHTVPHCSPASFLMDIPWADFSQFVGPILQAAHQQGYLAENGGVPYPWRAAVPPFAVHAKTDLQILTEQHYQWFAQWNAFPRLLRGLPFERVSDGTTYQQDTLIIYQLLPTQVTGPLYHTTQACLKRAIEDAGGLRPGRLTNVSTTGYNGAERWIHVSDSLKDQLHWIHNEKLLTDRSQNRDWVIFRIREGGTTGLMFPDPASQTGFVLPDELVPWTYLEEVDRVSLPPR